MNIYEIAQQAIKNSSVSASEKPVKKQNKSTGLIPHLAICSETNPSANNRHNSLMLKSKEDIGLVSLIKSENEAQEFEAFCKSLTDPAVLLDLYMFAKNSDEQEFIKQVINYQKDNT